MLLTVGRVVVDEEEERLLMRYLVCWRLADGATVRALGARAKQRQADRYWIGMLWFGHHSYAQAKGRSALRTARWDLRKDGVMAVSVGGS